MPLTREELPALGIAILQLLFLPASFAQMWRKIFKIWSKNTIKKDGNINTKIAELTSKRARKSADICDTKKERG